MRGRVHSREFKLAVCRQLASGEKRPAQVCREHELANSLLLRWRKEYGQYGDGAFLPGHKTEQEALERRVAELERFCSCGRVAVHRGRSSGYRVEESDHLLDQENPDAARYLQDQFALAFTRSPPASRLHLHVSPACGHYLRLSSEKRGGSRIKLEL